MRITLPLNHGKRYFWGKGWGSKPCRDTTHRMFKIQWTSKSKRPIFECIQTLPDGVTVEDPNEFVKKSIQRELSENRDPFGENGKVFPWPYAQRPIKGLSDDPNYHERIALVFNRYRKLLDPINQSLVFTNTVIESDEQMPESVNHLMADIEIDDQFIDLMERRLNWSKSSDSILRKLPINREFPYLDQRPPRVFGIPLCRKEHNYLRTLYDLIQILSSKHFGFVDIQKTSYPYCVTKYERNKRLIVFDLETDFMTTAKTSDRLPLFSTTPLITIDKPLASIEPLSWTTCFEEKNFYPTDYSFKLAPNHSIHTIYFTHNLLRETDNQSLVGRAIHYCYGYTTAAAKLLYGDQIEGKELPDPIPIQCVFINPKNFSLGFVGFQLNTTSFDSSLKNQVWIETEVQDLRQITKHLLAFQVNGFVDPMTKLLKSSIKITN